MLRGRTRKIRVKALKAAKDEPVTPTVPPEGPGPRAAGAVKPPTPPWPAPAEDSSAGDLKRLLEAKEDKPAKKPAVRSPSPAAQSSNQAAEVATVGPSPVASPVKTPPQPPLRFLADRYGKLQVKNGGVAVWSNPGKRQAAGWVTTEPPFQGTHTQWHVRLLRNVNRLQLGVRSQGPSTAHLPSTQRCEGSSFTWQPVSGELLVDNRVQAATPFKVPVLQAGTVLGVEVQFHPVKHGTLSLWVDGQFLGHSFKGLAASEVWTPVFCLHDVPAKCGAQGMEFLQL
mmetsp:Transcript_16257/g.28838  ORF Transcript_16257/g.28838 Transcript_16257/m.28838 type:complete len:284 (-) Transcript_16257:902-1753(-)